MQAGSQPAPAENRPVEEADTPIRPEHYVFVDNLRLVRPYLFDFKCHVKKRWEGKALVEMFAEEFPLLTSTYYHRAVEAGKLRVESSNGTPFRNLSGKVTADLKLVTGMCVRHLVHRHEPPVLADPVQVVTVTPDWVAVVKPACMPVHTVGQYRKNTVLGVLEADHPELGKLFPTNRLDKPVSGLLVLARTTAAAGRMRKSLAERTCEKTYVAKVQGRFPATAAELSCLARGKDAHVQLVTGTAADGAATRQQAQQTSIDAGGTQTEASLASKHQPAGQQAQRLPTDALRLSTDGVDMVAAVSSSGPQTQAMLTGAVDMVSGGSSAAARHTAGNVVVQVDVPLTWSARTNFATAVPAGASNGIEEGTDGESRPATTLFKLLHICQGDSDGSIMSVVECRPLTGRTHQIRVHLQYLGFPIANDTQYGGLHGKPLVFRRLREGFNEQQQQAQLQAQQNLEQQQQAGHEQAEPAGGPCTKVPAHEPCADEPHSKRLRADMDDAPQPGSSTAAEGGSALVNGTQSRHSYITAFQPQPAFCTWEPNSQHTRQQNGQPVIAALRVGSGSGSMQAGTQDVDVTYGIISPGRLAGTQVGHRIGGTQAGSQAGPDTARGQTGIQTGPGSDSTQTDTHDHQGAQAAAKTTAMVTPESKAELMHPAVVPPAIKAELMHPAVVPPAVDHALPSELQALYQDPRFRAPPELEEQVCPHCPCLVPQGYPIDLQPLWLHALRYKCDEWDFQVSLPAWAVVAAKQAAATTTS